MNINKILSGLSGVLVGFTVFILAMDIIAKPTNVAVSLNPIESLETYFFTFVWGLGDLGWVVGSIVLIGILALFYFIGVWIYKKIYSNKKK